MRTQARGEREGMTSSFMARLEPQEEKQETRIHSSIRDTLCTSTHIYIYGYKKWYTVVCISPSRVNVVVSSGQSALTKETIGYHTSLPEKTIIVIRWKLIIK